MLVVGLLGVVVNIGAAWSLRARRARARSTSRAPAQHVLTDLWRSLGAAMAGALVLLFGLDRADGDRGAVRRRC